MNTVELVVADTDIKSLPAVANLASVLINYPEGRVWFVENHLNMVSYYLVDSYTPNDKRNFWIDFSTYDSFYVGRTWESCWMIRKKTHLRDYIDEKWESFSRFCVDSLVRGYYIFVTINTAYISDYGWIGRHQIFIHGYDYDTGMFLCSDFFGKETKYDRRWIKGENLNSAYKHLNEVSPIDDFEGVCLWKYDPHSFGFDVEYGVRNIDELNLWHVRSILQRYLNGQSERDISIHKNVCYGIRVFDSLRQYLLDCYLHVESIAHQPIYIVNDHLAILLMLLNMLDIDDEFSALHVEIAQLQKNWRLIILMIMKYDIYVETEKPRLQIVNDICDRIARYMDDECRFIVKLIEKINLRL